MTEHSSSHPSPRVPSGASPGAWLLLFALAFWLAVVPLGVVFMVSVLSGQGPGILGQLDVVLPGSSGWPEVVLGLLIMVLTLGLQLFVFVPLWVATRQREREFLHTVTVLLIAISLYQALNLLARLPYPDDLTRTAAVRLALVLPFLLLCLGALEARRQGRSLFYAWRRVGLRLWHNPAALWLAVAAAAVIVAPWVLVGSLGSLGATMDSLLQALPNALGDEFLFRGFAFAWLWRAVSGRRGAAVASLVLFVAAQGGSSLPAGGLDALPHFGAALLLGLLATELTVRAGGSLWPAVTVHLLYVWFPLAFADPRSREELLHWLARVWMPLAAGGMGLLLWLGRKAASALQGTQRSRPSRKGLLAAVGFAVVVWVCVASLYVALGEPGFHPDGFLVFLEERADLHAAAAIADPAERRDWVYQTLIETAERTQAPLRAEIDRLGASYRPHYLVNALEVRDPTIGRSLRRSFASEPGVASVLFQPAVRPYPRTFRLPDMDPGGPSGIEWNVREIGADRVWTLGYAGEGVVIGNADTGVAWDHPALKAAYLGWDGQAAAHDYHWYDPWDGSTVPWDDSGHGTHTTGTVVGRDGENQVGIAPGARWIACRNMRHGIGNPGAYLSCMEFLLAPFPLDGDAFHGDPSRGADVVNNSWGCPAEEGCQPDTLRMAVDNLRAAGQMMVVSAGNEGPACGSVQDPPAIYDNVFSVGAISQGDQAAGFSSRGPVTVDGSQRAKPDIVAPGVDVRSSVPGGYASLPGTSMAGPHVAGAVALLWSIDPSLVGDIDRTEAILTETAEKLMVDTVCSSGTGELGVVCACGDDGPGSIPNQVYGWGEVDAWSAAQKLLKER